MISICRCHFNSIKVRLERFGLLFVIYMVQFQFHKGTIRTNHLESLDDARYYFNSIKVRLELASLDAVALNFCISIP